MYVEAYVIDSGSECTIYAVFPWSMPSTKTYVYLCTFRAVWSWTMPSTKAHLYVCWSEHYRFGIRVHDICGLFLVYVLRKSLCLIMYMLFTKIYYLIVTLYICHFRFFCILGRWPYICWINYLNLKKFEEIEICYENNSRKQFGNRRKCSPFPKLFSNASLLRVVKIWDCVVQN